MENPDKVQQLLDIVDGSRHWPRLKSIHDTAMAELEEIAAKTVDVFDEKRKQEDKKLIEEQKKLQAEAKKKAEEEAEEQKKQDEFRKKAQEQMAAEKAARAEADAAAAVRSQKILRGTDDTRPKAVPATPPGTGSPSKFKTPPMVEEDNTVAAENRRPL